MRGRRTQERRGEGEHCRATPGLNPFVWDYKATLIFSFFGLKYDSLKKQTAQHGIVGNRYKQNKTSPRLHFNHLCSSLYPGWSNDLLDWDYQMKLYNTDVTDWVWLTRSTSCWIRSDLEQVSKSTVSWGCILWSVGSSLSSCHMLSGEYSFFDPQKKKG